MHNKRLDACDKSEALISAIIGKMTGMNKARKKFILTIFLMYLGLRGRYNFLNMARYGQYSEQTYRNQFSQPFDFVEFNTIMIKFNKQTYIRFQLLNFRITISS